MTKLEAILHKSLPITRSAVSVTTIISGEIEESLTIGLRFKSAPLNSLLKTTPTFSLSNAATGRTKFQVAALSQLATAMGVMKLVEDNKLALDTDVNEYLFGSGFQLVGRDGQVGTLRQILSHTSGANVYAFKGYDPKDALPHSLVDSVTGMWPDSTRIEITNEQGKFRFSCGGYQIIQLIMEQVSGQSFPELMRKLVFFPLRMYDSTFETLFIEDCDDQNLTHSKGDASSAIYSMRSAYPFRIYPEQASTGLWSTSRDLAYMVLALLDALNGDSPSSSPTTTISSQIPHATSPDPRKKTFLSPSSAAEMIKNQVTNGDEVAHGFGVRLLRIQDSQSYRMQVEGVTNVGFRALIEVDLAKRSGFVMLRNDEGLVKEEYEVAEFLEKYCKFSEVVSHDKRTHVEDNETWKEFASNWGKALEFKLGVDLKFW